MRYELTDYEWASIRPMLPNKPRGVPRVNDRRVLNGIFWVLRSGTTAARAVVTRLKVCCPECCPSIFLLSCRLQKGH